MRDARLASGETADVWVAEGRISTDRVPGERVVDAGGRLVVPAFAEPHAHLDRAFSIGITGANRQGTLAEAITRFRASVDDMTAESLRPGAVRALEMMREAGVGHVRTHTAVGGEIGFRAWDAVESASRLVPDVEVRQVPMPMNPDSQRPDVRSWLEEAAERGAVAIGGAPWLAEDPVAATHASAELAGELGIGLDLHVDETDDPGVSTLQTLVAAVRDTGLNDKATAAHCCSLGVQPPEVARAHIDALGEAGVAIVVCPVSNLALQGGSSGARGLAPARMLMEAGLTVAVGVDNIRDVIVGVGTADPLRAAWLLAIAGRLWDEEGLRWVGDVVTRMNRLVCGLPSGLEQGDPADLLVVDASSLIDAVALVPHRARL